MTTPDEHTAHLFNSLIETVVDSAHGYRKAAEAAENPRFRTVFAERATRREALIAKLRAEVRRHGGEPQDEGTLLAKAHRVFLDIKDKVTGDNDRSVLEEVDRGEDFLKAKFEHALGDDRLTPLARQVIDDAYRETRADHDEIVALQASME